MSELANFTPILSETISLISLTPPPPPPPGGDIMGYNEHPAVGTWPVTCNHLILGPGQFQTPDHCLRLTQPQICVVK